MSTFSSTDKQNRSGETPGSWTWPLWATIAGIFGVIATFVSEQAIDEDVRSSGVGVIDALNHTNFQIGIITGLIATFAILAFAAGWHRWSEYVCKDSLAARLVTLALTASAGAMIIGYGFKGSLAVYLDGGMDGGSYPDENLLVIFMINDFAPWMCWWGATMASLGIVWLAFRESVLPKWIGIVAALVSAVPIAFVVATGLPGMSATSSLFFIIFGIGFALMQRQAITRTEPASTFTSPIAQPVN